MSRSPRDKSRGNAANVPSASQIVHRRGTVLRPPSAVSSFGGFRTPAAEYAAPSLKRPASETLHKLGSRTGPRRLPLYPSKQTSGGGGGMSVQCQKQNYVDSLHVTLDGW